MSTLLGLSLWHYSLALFAMQNYFAYTRVSTAKQGERGVSLQEQQSAIEIYAKRNGLHIIEWFEERETAAKSGRPIFRQMLQALRKKHVTGVIIHKIDRGARNLRDWADLGELIDRGIDVRFVHEPIDLQSRGGRLSADIQAVVAADYIRNLRQETIKGIYGRLKQGLYPLGAPLGYMDQGSGKPKIPDSSRQHLIIQAFEYYATGNYSLQTLTLLLQHIGLYTRSGSPVSRNTIALILRNPFYAGTIRIRRTGETFQGVHEPLISKYLFNRVQAILDGRGAPATRTHMFTFRRLVRCGFCNHHLVGEQHKGHVYYRCHLCRHTNTCIREEVIERAVLDILQTISFPAHSERYLLSLLEEQHSDWITRKTIAEQNMTLTLGQIRMRLSRLTDAFLEGHIDAGFFHEKQSSLLQEQERIERSRITMTEAEVKKPNHVVQYLSLAQKPARLYEQAPPIHRRNIVQTLTTNMKSFGKVVSGESVLSTSEQKTKEEILKRYLEVAWHIYTDQVDSNPI